MKDNHHSRASHFLCSQADLDALLEHHQQQNFSKAFSINGCAIFVVYARQQLHAYHNRCPHLGLPLNWVPDEFLDVHRELIQCSSHGALFTINNGHCVAGPCQGQALTPLAVETIGDNYFVALPDDGALSHTQSSKT